MREHLSNTSRYIQFRTFQIHNYLYVNLNTVTNNFVIHRNLVFKAFLKHDLSIDCARKVDSRLRKWIFLIWGTYFDNKITYTYR